MGNLKSMLPMIAMMIVAAIVVPRLAGMLWLFVGIAVVAWAIVVCWIAAKMGRLGGPVGRLFNGSVSKTKLAQSVRAEQREQRRKELSDLVKRETVEAELNGRFIGQPLVNEIVAAKVAYHVKTKAPKAPLSILIAGPASSGRSSFAGMLSTAMFGDRFQPMRVDCSGDSSVDWQAISKGFDDNPLAILMIDGIDRVGQGLTGGSFGAEMNRLLESGTLLGVEGKASRGIVILTATAEEGDIKELYGRHAGQGSEHLIAEMRKKAMSNPKIGRDIIDRLSVAAILKPVEDFERAGIVWSYFCDAVKKEHSISISQEGGYGLDDFLMEAASRWNKSSGVREAARWVGDAAVDALMLASEQGITHAVASYRDGKIFLERDYSAQPEISQAATAEGEDGSDDTGQPSLLGRLKNKGMALKAS